MPRARVASARVTPRSSVRTDGRHWLFWGAVVFFVGAALGVVARRAIGLDQARSIASLTGRLVALESDRVRAEADFGDASSRRVLAPIVARTLRLHVPSDTQVVLLARPELAPAAETTPHR